MTCMISAPMLPPMASVSNGVSRPTIRSMFRCSSASITPATWSSIGPSRPVSSPTAIIRSDAGGSSPTFSNARCSGVPSGTRSMAFW